ncbi:HAD family hydrolase [Neptunicella sp. SCSIO 80796]|uniref:HAD family hydrolase n=1 Tax=Neptunicella plasticusilytica TaxID=3117012 RepID=UPI003A4E27FE
MSGIYLFDWGNTLMVDIPGAVGKMCDWDHVKVIEGAKQTLAYLSATSRIYVASGAVDSSARDIEKALQRVDLADYISGYFCPANIGYAKGEAAFLPEIINRLDQPASRLSMVGDSWERDILPALQAGMQAVWYCPQGTGKCRSNVRMISSLTDLCA